MNIRVVTPAFCSAELLDRSLQHFYEYAKGGYEHWILLNHYPVHKVDNDQKTIEIANKYGCRVLDCAEDTSLHGSTNLLLSHLGWPDGFLLSYDADTAIEQMSHGFDVAMYEVMQEAKEKYNVALLALWGIGIDLKCRAGQQFQKVFIKNRSVLLHPSVEMWSVSMFDLEFIKNIGGLRQTNRYYGGIEVAMIEGFRKYGKRLAYLTEYKEKYFNWEGLTVPEYGQYKAAHLAGFQESFERWLEINKPELLK